MAFGRTGCCGGARAEIADSAVLDDPEVLERLLAIAAATAAAATAAGGPASAAGAAAPGPGRPSYAWPVFLGLVGSAVAGRRAARSGYRSWPYWAVGAGSTALLGWGLLTVMPAALGRGERARSIYGTIPRTDEILDQSYVPAGVPGVTDLDNVVPENHAHASTHASAVDLEPPTVTPPAS